MTMTPLTGLDRTSPTFRSDLDSFFLSGLPAFVTEANALETAVDADKLAAAASATAAAGSALAASGSATAASGSAASAAASANAAAMSAPAFVSGQTVAVGDVRYSPINFLTYRASTAGVRTTDPSADAANWARVSGTLVAADIKTINGTSMVGSGDVVAGVPTGSVTYFAATTPPVGFIKANGAAISRTTYVDLFTAIGTTFGAGNGTTTFNIPDLRGYFARGWDDARGIDSGRAFGSNQADANLSHTHTGSTDTTGAHTHDANTQYTGAGAGHLIDSGREAYAAATTSAGNHFHTLTIAAAGGTESRPKNVALLACIKY